MQCWKAIDLQHLDTRMVMRAKSVRFDGLDSNSDAIPVEITAADFSVRLERVAYKGKNLNLYIEHVTTEGSGAVRSAYFQQFDKGSCHPCGIPC